jgi:hypothetical protein
MSPLRPVSRVHRKASLGVLLAATIAASAACGSTNRRADAAISLVDELPKAERRAGSAIEEAVRVGDAGSGGDRARAILLRAPARVIWLLRIPGHARLRTAVALVPDANNPARPLGTGVTVRIGIADGRNYEELVQVKVPPAQPHAPFWQPIDVDLGAYGGWQWSLFYRPWNTTWRVNFTVAELPGPGSVAWRDPVIGSDLVLRHR